MVMRRIDLAPSFDALEANNPDFAAVRNQFNLDNLSVTVPHGSDDGSVDSNYHPEVATIDMKRKGGLRGSVRNLVLGATEHSNSAAIQATLESEGYGADLIRAEFKSYQSVLPSTDNLLQEQHSYAVLRRMFKESNKEAPRFLKYKFEDGIKPHHALCCLLLSDYAEEQERERAGKLRGGDQRAYSSRTSLVSVFSFGTLLPQINNPAAFIRYQFSRIVDAIPVDAVTPAVLRKTIRDKGLPVPNYFLDPGDDKQFSPHIALLVILQDDEKESRKLNGFLDHIGICLFAIVALLLRVVLEVIGGAGAIWGGAEVFTLRTAENHAFWRTASIFVGVLCFLRFVTLNAPRVEDGGDILGPAGPWSLRLPLRLRVVCDHPFHYFVRAAQGASRDKGRDSR